jgi:hypothetical protein
MPDYRMVETGSGARSHAIFSAMESIYGWQKTLPHVMECRIYLYNRRKTLRGTSGGFLATINSDRVENERNGAAGSSPEGWNTEPLG